MENGHVIVYRFTDIYEMVYKNKKILNDTITFDKFCVIKHFGNEYVIRGYHHS